MFRGINTGFRPSLLVLAMHQSLYNEVAVQTIPKTEPDKVNAEVQA